MSIIHGMLRPAAAKQMVERGTQFKENIELPFQACGISLVTHPRNTMVPTIHINNGFFKVLSPEKGSWEDRTLEALKHPVEWMTTP